jgi:hypothetical protein
MAGKSLQDLLNSHCQRFKNSEYPFAIVRELLEAAGFEFSIPKGGSHWTAYHPNLEHPDYPQKTIGFPVHGGRRGGQKVKAIYVKKACAVIRHMVETGAIPNGTKTT